LRETRFSICGDDRRWMIVARDLAQRIVDGRIADPFRGVLFLYDRFVRAKNANAVTWFRHLYDVEQQSDNPELRRTILADAARVLQA
jgi:hypothetical protein